MAQLHREITTANIILGRKLPVKCDNMKRGCQWVGTVGTLEEHYDRCEYTVISCKYRSIGCDMKLKRKDMRAHEQDDKAHLNKALNNIIKLKHTATELQEKVAQLQNDKIDKKVIRSTIFKVTEFQMKKDNTETFFSPSFYIRPGYHMKIIVYANGNGMGNGSHLSVYALVIKGKYDDELNWPFVGKFTFKLLNQLEDKNHHFNAIRFTPEQNTNVGHNWGCPKYIPHSKLPQNSASSTQYLKDDTLYFRISVEVSDHKPWLECTV